MIAHGESTAERLITAGTRRTLGKRFRTEKTRPREHANADTTPAARAAALLISSHMDRSDTGI